MQKKVDQNVHYFMSYYGFKFSIVLYCSSIVSFTFMKTSSISKMNTSFGFLVPKMLEMSNFIDPTQLFQELWGLLFCNFQYLMVLLCNSCQVWRHTWQIVENSNMNNSIHYENFDLSFFAFWWSIQFKKKMGDNCFSGVPL